MVPKTRYEIYVSISVGKYDYFSSVFCIVPKKVLLLKYRKCVSQLRNRYDYAKVVENARIYVSITPYCTLQFSRKETSNFLK